MKTENVYISMMKAVVKKTWDMLPDILAEFPTTAVAGRILTEIKKIGEEVKKSCQSKEEADKAYTEAVNEVIESCGGKTAFEKEIRQEIKAECASRNPKYINCAIFLVDAGDSLSDTEQEKLLGILTGELEAEDAEMDSFVKAFCEDYFAGAYEACDNPIELGQEYISFNFDDANDHEYLEDDLKTIMDELNRIVGRKVLCEYEGFGTDDSVRY